MKDNTKLHFEDRIKEVKEFYEDLDKIINYGEQEKERFFKDQIKVLEILTRSILRDEFRTLRHIQVDYCLLGILYELTLKLCLLKENWKRYLIECKENPRKKTFEDASSKLLEILKNKNFNEKQVKRSKHILTYARIQRNNFVHSPFKGSTYAVIERHLFEFLVILYDSFKLNIDKDLLSKTLNKFKKNPEGVLDFEEVFEDKVKAISQNLKKNDSTEVS